MENLRKLEITIRLGRYTLATLLEVENINTFYGDSHILFDVSFNVDQGEIVAFLGRNGVGKTTTLRSIMGLTPIRNGKIKFAGREISKEPIYSRTIMGIGCSRV
jgi:branched-chain amino acid transport system ATP-binding protein